MASSTLSQADYDRLVYAVRPSSDGTYTCPINGCRVSYARRGNLNARHAYAHVDGGRRTARCGTLSYTPPAHSSAHAGNPVGDPVSENKTVHPCNMCGEEFPSLSRRNRHSCCASNISHSTRTQSGVIPRRVYIDELVLDDRVEEDEENSSIAKDDDDDDDDVQMLATKRHKGSPHVSDVDATSEAVGALVAMATVAPSYDDGNDDDEAKEEELESESECEGPRVASVPVARPAAKTSCNQDDGWFYVARDYCQRGPVKLSFITSCFSLPRTHVLFLDESSASMLVWKKNVTKCWTHVSEVMRILAAGAGIPPPVPAATIELGSLEWQRMVWPYEEVALRKMYRV